MNPKKSRRAILWYLSSLSMLVTCYGQIREQIPPPVEAINFKETKVYESSGEPGYTAWVSFFPGEKGQWYLGFDEVTVPDQPMPQVTAQQFYEFCQPSKYDKSQYLMEMVLLESRDYLQSWRQISREPVRFHHASHSFSQARTSDGRFLRFITAKYSLIPQWRPNEIFLESKDNGKTWNKMPPFLVDGPLWYFPHRIRALKDGTFVLCIGAYPDYGKGTERPVRAAIDLNALNESQLFVFFSFDQGKTWAGPISVLCGITPGETDFVELPEGNLLFINCSLWGAAGGTQVVYRKDKRFFPGSFHKATSGLVPETVCIAADGILVGCIRNSDYLWSDDQGRTWWRLQGTKSSLYQPWIHHLGNGKIACAGHFGADVPIGLLGKPGPYNYREHIGVQTFELKVHRKTRNTKILVARDFDAEKRRWLNGYTVTLRCDDNPLPDKEVEFWYAERWPGGKGDTPEAYDPFGLIPLEKRMTLGGKRLKAKTDSMGNAHFSLPDLDKIADENKLKELHHSIQVVARFNADRSIPEYKSAQTPQMEFYTIYYMDEPLFDNRFQSK